MLVTQQFLPVEAGYWRIIFFQNTQPSAGRRPPEAGSQFGMAALTASHYKLNIEMRHARNQI